MVERDVVLAKIAVIDRCINRIQHIRSGGGVLSPVDIEDITVLNLARAAQAAIDLATHVVSTEGYGLPADVGEAFVLLGKHAVIGTELATRLRKMVGFRNIAVHNYQSIDPQILERIVEDHLGDLQALAVAERFQVQGQPG
ncbi:MAG TPA: DUF86 domain-containing protein [Polyangia bacterium]|jgi:uncharacterized protein YutE (UPF0331/DUF86 family)